MFVVDDVIRRLSDDNSVSDVTQTDDSESDSAGGDTGSNDTSLQEVDYSVLKGIQLQVPCNTWIQEHAIANFGVDSLDRKQMLKLKSSDFSCKSPNFYHS